MRERESLGRLARRIEPMQNRNRFRPLIYLVGAGALVSGAGALHFGFAQSENVAAAPTRAVQNGRPRYDLRADLDAQLLTLAASAQVTVPASGADPLRDVVFFLYANADGVGGAGAGRINLKVENVSVDGAPARWNLNGAVLRVALPVAQTQPFVVAVNYRGVVPRSDGKDDDLMGGMLSADVSGLLGLGTPGGKSRAQAR